jgi:murein DD-endopeptidase MepM/ murein hydrolase activator NlpD
MNFRITSGYGMRTNPIGGNIQFHGGLDLAAPQGTEILAAADGTVIETGWDGVLGNFVKIGHSGNWTSTYGHMQKIGTEVGTRVGSGAVIGWVGSTGYSTGPHLHFELWQGDQSRDPGDVLRH